MSHNQKKQKILVLDGVFAVCRFDKKKKIDLNSLTPLTRKGFFSVTVTDEEISIVTEKYSGIKNGNIEKNWKCFRIQGSLNFDLLGIIHGITDILMKAEVSTFVISTYNTDYFLVRDNMLNNAIQALQNNGYDVDFASAKRGGDDTVNPEP